MAISTNFEDRTVLVLRQAYRAMRAADPGDSFALYAACRQTIEMLAPVDSFYVALIRTHDQMTIFPYTFDSGLAVATEALPYGPHGLTSWILASRRTYRFSEDGGALINRGYALGDASELSRDAIVVPVIDETGTVMALMTVLSTRPDVFTDEHARAMECLADALGICLVDMLHPVRSERLARLFPDLGDGQIRDNSDLLNVVSHGLARIHTMLTAEPGPADDPSSVIAAAADQCLRLQTRLAQAAAAHRDPLAALTKRELEVTDMIVAQPRISTRSLAAALHLSEATVKTHVSRILYKTGCSQRAELQHLARQRQA